MSRPELRRGGDGDPGFGTGEGRLQATKAKDELPNCWQCRRAAELIFWNTRSGLPSHGPTPAAAACPGDLLDR